MSALQTQYINNIIQTEYDVFMKYTYNIYIHMSIIKVKEARNLKGGEISGRVGREKVCNYIIISKVFLKYNCKNSTFLIWLATHADTGMLPAWYDCAAWWTGRWKWIQNCVTLPDEHQSVGWLMKLQKREFIRCTGHCKQFWHEHWLNYFMVFNMGE